ncbi:cytochrome c oxidase accessory protein CcoG [Bdellovibrio svalbardensis]|uniref:Cytochrome c oxidase accessory protein CcoG n=1 Tax=Bdellovibrio svalbardensis TaxID=2972972 RepID=A0ABT6DGS4_9BACT|nr:cytochrome c oxidase accessory protein CcoG [Bdellovibrio svalbardensis]MDG0816013.1 cytochrome c oxidase accessory protein CcoG [Bdellovibrio svalbardensis]
MSDLDSGKLTSVDEHGDRLGIIPAEVRGFYRKHRTWTQLVLLVIFLGLPWTTIQGRQTILLNIPDREFALFGMLFKSHDAPLIFFILAFVTLGLAFVTSIWGRVWCGWACPQTVFIDAIYRRIELWTEGPYLKRRQLQASPMTMEKFLKSGSKWFLFVVVSSLIAHSFMAYFVGAKNLIQMIQNPPDENLTYFILVSAFTGLILFDFAWFREQFCVIMCPYGRIQSLLLDQKSLAIVYDVKRGEPRKAPNVPKEQQGDCVACNRCVQVCPTGIDIRNGLQMECIACTACADACDEIMEKVKKPKGLIRYDTLDFSKISLFRPRSMIYMAALIVLAAGLTYAISSREPVHIAILRGQGLPYSYVKNEQGEEVILNQFKIHIQNQGTADALYRLELPPDLLAKGVQLTVGENPLTLRQDESHEWYFFIRVSPLLMQQNSGQLKTRIILEDLKSSFKTEKELILVGPKNP